MNIINIINKNKALILEKQGFKYLVKETNGIKVYEFIGTPELLACINSKFNKQDFFMSKFMNF